MFSKIKAHCYNCKHYDDELSGCCGLNRVSCPPFTLCSDWEFNYNLKISLLQGILIRTDAEGKKEVLNNTGFTRSLKWYLETKSKLNAT